MSLTESKVTDEVSTTGAVQYLVRCNGEAMFVIDDETQAKIALDSLAAHDAKLHEKKRTKVFREDLNDGSKIVISTQSLGKYLYNSVPVVAVTFDMIPVQVGVVTKSRRARIPLLPTPEDLENALKRRVEEQVDVPIV